MRKILFSLMFMASCVIVDDMPEDPPEGVCMASALEFCDKAVECGQIADTAHDECMDFALAYCEVPGDWDDCRKALDAMECPVDNTPVDHACWSGK